MGTKTQQTLFLGLTVLPMNSHQLNSKLNHQNRNSTLRDRMVHKDSSIHSEEGGVKIYTLCWQFNNIYQQCLKHSLYTHYFKDMPAKAYQDVCTRMSSLQQVTENNLLTLTNMECYAVRETDYELIFSRQY